MMVGRGGANKEADVVVVVVDDADEGGGARIDGAADWVDMTEGVSEVLRGRLSEILFDPLSFLG